jgi:hypothetical protein
MLADKSVDDGGGGKIVCDTWANLSNISTLEQNREQETSFMS